MTRTFWMQTTEVTRADFRTLVGFNPSGLASCDECGMESAMNGLPPCSAGGPDDRTFAGLDCSGSAAATSSATRIAVVRLAGVRRRRQAIYVRGTPAGAHGDSLSLAGTALRCTFGEERRAVLRRAMALPPIGLGARGPGRASGLNASHAMARLKRQDQEGRQPPTQPSAARSRWGGCSRQDAARAADRHAEGVLTRIEQNEAAEGADALRHESDPEARGKRLTDLGGAEERQQTEHRRGFNSPRPGRGFDWSRFKGAGHPGSR